MGRAKVTSTEISAAYPAPSETRDSTPTKGTPTTITRTVHRGAKYKNKMQSAKVAVEISGCYVEMLKDTAEHLGLTPGPTNYFLDNKSNTIRRAPRGNPATVWLLTTNYKTAATLQVPIPKSLSIAQVLDVFAGIHVVYRLKYKGTTYTFGRQPSAPVAPPNPTT